MTILYILLFLVCLSTLIMVHEAGHLVTAKIFKVYCFEYALGFGPRLFSFKRKNGETRFSIRAIPFGGFVSMYGEADAVPPEFEGVEIDKSRSINNIKHWKRAIIMTAGIMMNFVLAMIVFFIYEIAFPAYTPRTAHITVAPDTLAYSAGLRSQDHVYGENLIVGNDLYVLYDNDATLTYLDSTTKQVYVGYSYSQMTIKNTDVSNKSVAFLSENLGEITEHKTTLTYEAYFDKTYTEGTDYEIGGYFHWAGHDGYKVYFAIVEHYLDTNAYGQPLPNKYVFASVELSEAIYNKFVYVPDGEYISMTGSINTRDIGGNSTPVFEVKQYETARPDVTSNLLKDFNKNPDIIEFDVEVVAKGQEDSTLGLHHITCPVANGGLGNDANHLGIAMQLDEHQNSYGEAVGNSFADFGKSTTLIFRGLGQLFTAEGFKNVGGIVAIGVVTTQTLEQNGFGNFLYMWAMISVNLGIVNLLPFPGLDGWQFLVTIVEGVAHKEIPAKVKNTMSAIGLLLLFALMIMIVIKDIIMVV